MAEHSTYAAMMELNITASSEATPEKMLQIVDVPSKVENTKGVKHAISPISRICYSLLLPFQSAIQ